MVALYLVTLIISYLFSSIATRISVSDMAYYSGNGKKVNWAIIGLMMFLTAVSGLRYMNYYGSDEWVYRTGAVDKSLGIFDIICPEGLNSIINWLSNYVFISKHGAFAYGQFYILATSAIVVILFVKSLWDYSEDFSLSIFLFIAMWYFFTAMNIIRQFVAVAILFYGYRYLRNGEFKKYIIFVLLAFGFHTSAIIMIPLYFVIRYKRLLNMGWIVALIVFFVLGRIDIIGNALFGESAYSIYFSGFGDYSVNPLRLLSIAIPCIIYILFRKNLTEEGSISDICDINMMIFVLIVSVFSIQNVYYNRISYYFSTVCLVAFPKLRYVFTENSQKFFNAVMISLFFIFGLYSAYISSGNYYNILFGTFEGVL